jgi:hypothetical protein
VKWGVYILLSQVVIGTLFALGGHSAGGAWNAIYVV